MKEVYDTARIDAPAAVFHDINAIQSAPPRAARRRRAAPAAWHSEAALTRRLAAHPARAKCR